MNHLAFVLWICLWPVAVSLDSYLTAKKRKIQGKEQVEIKDVALPTLIIWIAIAVILY